MTHDVISSSDRVALANWRAYKNGQNGIRCAGKVYASMNSSREKLLVLRIGYYKCSFFANAISDDFEIRV